VIRFLIDTNVPSELSKPRPSPEVQAWVALYPRSEHAISVITLAEFTKGIAQHSDVLQSERLQLWLDTKLRRWFTDRVLPISAPVAERAGTFIGEHQKAGRHLTMADALIAATAAEYGLTLIARNTRDFQFIDVPLINPWLSPDPVQ
jgi:predicted nucleic acid-binding protein